MINAPFEQYINKLLNQHDALDLLRQNALNSPEHHTKLRSAVDKVLLENYLDQYFAEKSYDTQETENRIVSKLNYLRNKLLINKVPEDSVFIVLIDYSLFKISHGYALTKDLLIYLNKINNRYE